MAASIKKPDAVGDGRLRPAPPAGELDETRAIFDSGPFAPLCENMTSSRNRKYIKYCIVVRK